MGHEVRPYKAYLYTYFFNTGIDYWHVLYARINESEVYNSYQIPEPNSNYIPTTNSIMSITISTATPYQYIVEVWLSDEIFQ